MSIFIIGEIFYAIWLKNYILGLTGIITTILSILYHQTHEKYWQPWETISAHISMFYIFLKLTWEISAHDAPPSNEDENI